MGYNPLALELRGPPTRTGFGVSFAGSVFVVDDVPVELVANGGLASSEGAGNLSDTVAFVA